MGFAKMYARVDGAQGLSTVAIERATGTIAGALWSEDLAVCLTYLVRLRSALT